MHHQDILGVPDVPSVVEDFIRKAGGADVPVDPINPFYWLQRGILPIFVLNWFLNIQSHRFSNMTWFYRALHMIEHYHGAIYGILDDPESD